MGIVGEIILWSVLGIAISVALGVTLPAFFRMMRQTEGDIRPDFLDDGKPPAS